jgi:FkbM family methyltransferase
MTGSRHALPVASALRAIVGAARAPLVIRNWITYLVHYWRKGARSGIYYLRDGTVIRTVDPISVGTLAVVFLRRHYGTPRDFRTVVDIGANIGVFALFAAKLNESASVHCFEPHATNYRQLCVNISENHLGGRVHPVQLGVAAKTGARSFVCGRSPTHSVLKEGVQGGQNKFDCSCITLSETLDRTEHDFIDLVKMNCEGAEYEIIYGCSAATIRRVGEFRLEYHNLDFQSMNGRALCEHLSETGFRITRYDDYSATAGFIWAVNQSVTQPR